jgi:putative NIF3 family GTP cyclohydrolase 1 type 2
MDSKIKVSDVIERLQTASGSSWVDKPWDGLQTGSMDSPVTGIAVLWSPGLQLLKQAVEKGCNLILAKDPVYWYEKEEPRKIADSSSSRISEGLAGGMRWEAVEKTDAYRAKKEFIDSDKLNIYRISENWDGKPSRESAGFLQALGWKAEQLISVEPLNPNKQTAIVTVPQQDLLQLAKAVKGRLNSKSARLIGDSSARISKVAVHPAYLTVAAATKIGQIPGLDMIVTGESCEWEAFVYTEDWITAGHGKGFLMVGLAVASDTAATAVGDWVRKTVAGTKVEVLHAGDPMIAVNAGRLRA